MPAAAVQAYGRLHAQGQWIDRVEHVDLKKLFDRMTEAEMETYAKEGDLLGWFKLAVSATPLTEMPISLRELALPNRTI